MRVLVRISEENHLVFHILTLDNTGEKYESNQVFDITNTAIKELAEPPNQAEFSTNHWLKKGFQLYEYIPIKFLESVENKRAQLKALVLYLDKPSLAKFPWEYIPIEKSDIPGNIASTWQALPLLRSILGSSIHDRPVNLNSVRFQFLNSLKARNLLDAPEALAPNPNYRTSPENLALAIQNMKQKLLNDFTTNDFIHIACHGHPGCLSLDKEQDTVFLKLADIDLNHTLPRIVLADCCYTADTGNEEVDWNNTFVGRFIRKEGSAIYCANLGEANYSTGKTVFSELFIRYFTDDKLGQLSFIDIVHLTRSNQLKDQYNTQVIYIADNWNVDFGRDKILKENFIYKEVVVDTSVSTSSKWCPRLYCKVLFALSLVTLALSRFPQVCIVKPFENKCIGIGGLSVAFAIWMLRVLVLHRKAKKHLDQPSD